MGLQKAFAMYNNPALTHYSNTVHKKLVNYQYFHQMFIIVFIIVEIVICQG